MGFFRGRYGMDQLGVLLMILSFAIEILGRILMIRVIYYVGLALFILMILRSFSRNIEKRSRENQKLLNLKNRILNWKYFRQQKKKGTYTYTKKEQQKVNKKSKGPVYCFYYCPSCKQQVRIPAGKGKVKVTCPRCKEKFDAYS